MTDFEQFQRLADLLHAGGSYRYFFTPDGGNKGDEDLTMWRETTKNFAPPASWWSKNLYFGVNPVAEVPTTRADGRPAKQNHVRARNGIVSHVSAVYIELDGKDFVPDADWQPFYEPPDLTVFEGAEHRKGKVNGALVRAQNAAIDAAYKSDPERYKALALAALENAPLRASAAWDSGGGYQAVWLLDMTWAIDDSNRDTLKHIQRAWVHLLGGDGAVCDLARVLRVPGSKNFKPRYAPDYPEVCFLWADLTRRYSLASIEALTPKTDAPTAKRRILHVPDDAPEWAHDLAGIGSAPDLPLHRAIDWYNEQTNLHDLLLSFGYTDAGNGRMNRPGGDSAGVLLHDGNRSYHFSSNDPLNGEHRVSPAYALCVYEYAGNVGAMLADLAAQMPSAWWLRFTPDEAGISDAFFERHGDDWRYITMHERWHYWTGTHWQRDETRALRMAIGAMMDTAHTEALKDATRALDAAGDDEDLRKEAKRMMAEAKQWRRRDRTIAAVDNLCRDRRAMHPDNLSSANLLNFANGTLDLDRFDFRKHDRADMLTHCLPYEYDPSARCPRWTKFVCEVLIDKVTGNHDEDLGMLLQEAVGYSLTAETRYEAMFWLSGGGANGKSTMLKTLSLLLGSMAQSFELDALSRQDAGYHLATLGGARIVWCTEAGSGAVADRTLKALASGDTIRARPIRGEPIDIRPVCKVWWALNSEPPVRDTTDGFWRKLNLIPFNRTFAPEERETALSDMLARELPGILNWAIDGLKRLRTRDRFIVAKAVTEAVAEYRESQNPVELWVKERATTANPGAWAKSSDAYEDYRFWCDVAGRNPMNQTNFGKEVKRLVKWDRKEPGVMLNLGLLTTPDELIRQKILRRAPLGYLQKEDASSNGNHANGSNGTTHDFEASMRAHGL